MKLISSLAVGALVSFVPAVAAACPPPLALPDAAHDLAYATQVFSQILAARGEGDHVYQDALTLYDAAEHFEEEVTLGPEDLDVDFQAIEETFEEMRGEFRGAPCVQQNPAARSAWFQIAEANLRLRIAWFAHPG